MDLSQGEVHPTLGVGEDPVAEQSLEQTVRRRGVVTFSDTDECEYAALDGTDDLAVYTHVGVGDTLNETDHVAADELDRQWAITTTGLRSG